MIEKKRDIRGLSQEAIIEFFEAHNEQSFRAKQVYQWLWQKSASSFDEMTNLSKSTRTLLNANFNFNLLEVDLMQRSKDGTIKNAVKLHDGAFVESVLIPTEKRITACVSSQVGCSLDCTFCATASLKRMRNLGPDEIYDQVVVIHNQGKEYFGRPLTNIVFMGMGEPLLNYNNVLAAIEKITDPKGLGLSPRRITLSTIGVPKLIKKMADDGVKFNLAISLHSAIEEKRAKLMPLAHKSATLVDLRESLQYWYAKTGRGVTFEYVIWKDLNDTEQDVKALAKFCGAIPTKVNIIQYNPIDNGPYTQASQESVDMYKDILERKGIITTIRHSRGQDIDAACGQLANKVEE
ncbi:MAG: 23S rRNA (adenine(2503)-C(2))-methyltransferase RlmN [Schleiferiaceae bacterium]|jgi:23S rRNA (adenine2503-C2)-methyltransferase|nr:23S rRNA (adenine(2503)-C(2))-methyltransferase RlmN [Schleiferiaceae bacterium]|tara:strand:- start:3084 stop:4133 length:1050 start_codon:yes stop_codon:yes gene_type:complete